MQRPRRPPKYCQGFVDRHGRARWYFRRQGYKRVPLPGLPWSPSFMEAYELAMAGGEGFVVQPGDGRIKPGTVDAVAVAYYRSLEFSELEGSTQYVHRTRIERFRRDHGDKPIALIEREHIKAMMMKRKAQPEAANAILRVCRILMRQALDMKLRRDDPTIGIKRMRNKSSGHLTWTEQQIAQYEAYHQPGTRAHLALALLLNTAQRRSDVVLMGRHQCSQGKMRVKQVKTGAVVVIPIHPRLQQAIDAMPLDNMNFLVTQQGKPFTPEGFTNWFRGCVKEAGLPEGLSAHGLRKAACRRLAEAGCTPHQIMAISGHRTLSEVTRYTRAVSQEDLAQEAFAVLDRHAERSEHEQELSNLSDRFDNSPRKSLK